MPAPLLKSDGPRHQSSSCPEAWSSLCCLRGAWRVDWYGSVSESQSGNRNPILSCNRNAVLACRPIQVQQRQQASGGLTTDSSNRKVRPVAKLRCRAGTGHAALPLLLPGANLILSYCSFAAHWRPILSYCSFAGSLSFWNMGRKRPNPEGAGYHYSDSEKDSEA